MLGGMFSALVYKELTGAPVWLADGLRVATFVVCVLLILIIMESLAGRPVGDRPGWFKLVLWGQLIWSVRIILAGLDRWGKPMWLGGTPVSLVIGVLWLGGWAWRYWPSRPWRRR